MTDPEVVPGACNAEAEPPPAEFPGQHRPNGSRLEKGVRAPQVGDTEVEQEASKLCRRGPEAGGCLFGVGAPPPLNRLPILPMPSGRYGGEPLRERLIEGTFRHADWTQNLGLHHRVKGLASQVLNEYLRDGVASP